MWLTSYDIDGHWGPLEVELIGEARVGTRTDWAWAVPLEPPVLRTNGETSVASFWVASRGLGSGPCPTGGQCTSTCACPTRADQTRPLAALTMTR